ncbi:hypothetical protein CPB86DRAFT_795672 [Serendipita vermifera]|nr:hypothetical protein CPB86DRAFT_795672 [Serendipita vermifera]
MSQSARGNVPSPTPEDRRKAQDFQLPAIVKADVDSFVHIANTLAITTALFAAVQIALAQIVDTSTIPASPALTTLRWFMYSAVLVNMGCTASAISVVNITSSLSNQARRLILKNPGSTPRRYVDGEPLEDKLLQPQEYRRRLEEFGMPPRLFPFITRCMLMSFVLGSLFIFISFCLWVYLTQSLIPFIAMVVIAAMAFALTILVLVY